MAISILYDTKEKPALLKNKSLLSQIKEVVDHGELVRWQSIIDEEQGEGEFTVVLYYKANSKELIDAGVLPK
jgi:hypothetical protein